LAVNIAAAADKSL